MLEELKLVEKLDPRSIKFVNEGHVLINNGAVKKEFKDLIQYFMENEVPLDGLGFMSHHVKSLTGMDDLFTRLTNLAALDEEYEIYDLQLKITEFDVDTDQQDEEQLAIQADYTRDFYTCAIVIPMYHRYVHGVFGNQKCGNPGQV